MDRRKAARIATTIAWTVSLGLAALVVLPGLIVRAFPSGDPGPAPDDVPTGAVVLDVRERFPVPPAAGRSAWQIRSAVLSVDGVAGLGDGRWLVLDRMSRALHLLDPDLRVVRSFGREGDGPGELARPAHMAVLGDSLVAVLDLTGTRLDLFSVGGGFLGRRTVSVPGCPVGLSAGFLPEPGHGFAAWGICSGPGGPRWTAVRIAPDGRTRALEAVSLAGPSGPTLPLGRGLAVWRGDLRIGHPDGCFTLPDGEAGPALCLPDEPAVPFPDDLGSSTHDAGDPGPGPRGLPPGVDLPETLPPFVSVRWSAAGPVLTLPDLDEPDGRIVLVRDDGSLLVLDGDGPLWPGPADLLVTRDFADGTGFRTVPWP